MPTAVLTAVLTAVPAPTSPATACAQPAPAGREFTRDTAHALERHEWRLGLGRAQYGIVDAFDVGTYVVPWLILMTNIDFKARVWSNERWAVALQSGFYRLDLTVVGKFLPNEEQSDAVLWGVPSYATVSYRFNQRWSLSFAAQFTYLSVSGNYNDDDFNGVAAISTMQLKPMVEWKFSRYVALLLQLRYMPLRYTGGGGSVNAQIDESTEATVQAAARVDAPPPGESIAGVTALRFSWEHLNIRTGLSLGNVEIPSANLVIPTFMAWPQFDIYWRF